MDINITGKHFELSENVRNYAEDRIGKLSKYFDGIKRAEVVLGPEGDHKQAEVILSLVKGKVQISHGNGETIYAAIDEAHDKAEKQLTRFKEKIRNHRKGENPSAPPASEQ